MSSSEQGPVFGGAGMTQDFQISQATARVPEKVRPGFYSTGAIVINGPQEFMLDFVQQLAQPKQLLARLIIPTTLMPGLIQALGENIANYTARFGPPPALPPIPPDAQIPPAQEVYEQMKVTDEVLCGHYANGVMVAHGPAEFCLDFISSGFPRSVVTCRIFMAAAHAPRLLDSLKKSFAQYRERESRK